MEFDEFVRNRSTRLLRLAYAFTRDHALAEDLLQTAYARCWRRWDRIDGDPEPYVRQALVNTYNSWWQRRWNGERPSDDVPDRASGAPQDTVDERDEVWRALSRLPRQQQAVLVLRYFEDLSEAQIADILTISPGSVKSYASKGLAKLRVDPTLSTLPLPEAEPVPAGSQRVAGVRERIRHARTLRVATAAAVTVIVLVAGFVTGMIVRDKPKPAPIEPRPTPSAEHARAMFVDGLHVVKFVTPTEYGDRTETTLRYTPTGRKLHVVYKCVRRNEAPVSASFMITTPGGLAGSRGSIPECEQSDKPLAPDWWTGDTSGVAIDAESEIVVTMKLTTFAGEATIPNDGSYAAAIAEEVSFEDYPFPPAPPSLAPLKRAEYPDARLFEPSGSPAGVDMPWTGTIGLYGAAQTPGILHVEADGVEVATMDWWDYDDRDHSFCSTIVKLPKPASHARITVRAEHMMGDWYLLVATGKNNTICPIMDVGK